MFSVAKVMEEDVCQELICGLFPNNFEVMVFLYLLSDRQARKFTHYLTLTGDKPCLYGCLHQDARVRQMPGLPLVCPSSNRDRTHATVKQSI